MLEYFHLTMTFCALGMITFKNNPCTLLYRCGIEKNSFLIIGIRVTKVNDCNEDTLLNKIDALLLVARIN